MRQVETKVVTQLSDKEELIKFVLNRWVEFQMLLAELKNINSWFEQREDAMTQYRRIVTEREFEIALEDVKVSYQVHVVGQSSEKTQHFSVELFN